MLISGVLPEVLKSSSRNYGAGAEGLLRVAISSCQKFGVNGVYEDHQMCPKFLDSG